MSTHTPEDTSSMTTHYWSHRGRRRHPTNIASRIGSGLLLPIGLVLGTGVFATELVLIPTRFSQEAGTLIAALGASFFRLLIAYAFSVVVGVSLGLFAERNRKLESALLPIFDVMESMPVLAFFPVCIILFIRIGFLNGAAIFIITFSMIWNIAFSVLGGVRQIPQDIKAVGTVFGLSKTQRLRKILLPAVFPTTLTGSILAFADGWNLLIVAEALREYAPSTDQAHDLFGIGSILVHASSSGDTTMLVTAMIVLVFAIALVNLAVWQPLLAFSERFKFE